MTDPSQINGLNNMRGHVHAAGPRNHGLSGSLALPSWRPLAGGSTLPSADDRTMMRYALVLYADVDAARAASRAQADTELRRYAQVTQELADEGVLLGGEAFRPAFTACRVAMTGESPETSDVPSSELGLGSRATASRAPRPRMVAIQSTHWLGEVPQWIPGSVVGALVAGALLFDRAMLSAEKHGWVYWRRNKASRSSLGSAMLELQSILEPDKEHVVEERARQRGDIQQAGDDDPLDDSPQPG